MPPMLVMPDAAGHRARSPDQSGLSVKVERSCGDLVRPRPFVYQRRNRKDALGRIRSYEERYPARARRLADDPDADFIDADEDSC
jgi:hypothetical protein